MRAAPAPRAAPTPRAAPKPAAPSGPGFFASLFGGAKAAADQAAARAGAMSAAKSAPAAPRVGLGTQPVPGRGSMRQGSMRAPVRAASAPAPSVGKPAPRMGGSTTSTGTLATYNGRGKAHILKGLSAVALHGKDTKH